MNAAPGGRITVPAVITNEFLQASVDADGIVNITDLRNGRILRDCLRLEDMADAGDSYKFIPGGDMPLYSDDWEKEVSMGECTGLKQTVRILYTMKLPEAYCFEEQARTRKTAVSSLALELTLRKGCPFVEINYTLDNASKDHRLRLCVDTDIAPAESWADSAFDVVRRTNENHYPGTYAKVEPNASFAALQQEGKGVAVFTVGAHAYEHPENRLDRLAFTLVRATGLINQGETEYFITPANQCLRRLTGRMAVCPFTGDLVSADIPNKALAFRAPLLAAASACDTRKFAGGRPCVQDTALMEYFYLPDTHPQVAMESNRSAISVTGEGITVSAFKQSEDESCLILRLYNYTEQEATAAVSAAGRIFRTRLDEVPRKILGNDRVTMTLRAKEILTLCIQK